LDFVVFVSTLVFAAAFPVPFAFGRCTPICTDFVGDGAVADSSDESSLSLMNSWLKADLPGVGDVFRFDFDCNPGSGTGVFLNLLMVGSARS
jgi:hypothetical protein